METQVPFRSPKRQIKQRLNVKQTAEQCLTVVCVAPPLPVEQRVATFEILSED